MAPYWFCPWRVLPEVAGRRHDDDARVDHALGRERQRVGDVRLGDRRANREVDDADVVGGPVRDDPVERRDHVADVAAAAIVEDLQADQVRRRGDAARAPSVSRPLPAMMPATCVPWPLSS